MICSGRDKIETPEQFKQAEDTANKLDLDGLLIIGGDDSNTNACLLGEYFRSRNMKTCVIGCPKTINGDLKCKEVPTSFGFDTACKPLERIGRSIKKEIPDDLLVISCEEDYQTCASLRERGACVFSSELVLNGTIIQKLEYERHKLFADRVKQTRSTMWLKDTALDRFLPVPKYPKLRNMLSAKSCSCFPSLSS